MTATVAVGELPFFNMSSPEFSVASPDLLRAREDTWCVRTNYGYAAIQYQAVHDLLRHPALRQGGVSWPEDNGVTEGQLVDWWKLIITHREGDDHKRLRRLVNPALARSSMLKHIPYFQALANELIDGFSEAGEVEFMHDFAKPFAARILCHVIGLADDDWPELADWSTDLMLAFGPAIITELPRIEAAITSIYDHVDKVLAARDHADDTTIAQLIAAQEREGMSVDELRALIAALIFGGMDTTKMQLGLAMDLFATHPEQWQKLAADPSLADNAVEESLRQAPTVTWITRLATSDFEYGGIDFAEGTTIHLLTYPADTDPLVLDDQSFDIEAKRAPHMVFGGGAHHCLGHFLARMDMGVALPALARRLPDLRFAAPAQKMPNAGLTGPTELRLAFTPTPALGERA